MKYFSCIASFGNLNWNITTKAKNLVEFLSYLQVFPITPDILVVRTKRNGNKDLKDTHREKSP